MNWHSADLNSLQSSKRAFSTSITSDFPPDVLFKVVDKNVSQRTEVYRARTHSSLAGDTVVWAKCPLLFFNKIAVALEHKTNGSSWFLRATGAKRDT